MGHAGCKMINEYLEEGRRNQRKYLGVDFRQAQNFVELIKINIRQMRGNGCRHPSVFPAIYTVSNN